MHGSIKLVKKHYTNISSIQALRRGGGGGGAY